MATRDHIRSHRQIGAENRDDDGFTLIELMVVVLVIAILLAIAVPTFLGARERSQDRAAQSSLRNALTAAKVAFVDSGDYRGATAAGLLAIEPSLDFKSTTVASADDDEVSIGTNAGNTIFYAAAISESGTCFHMRDDSQGTAGTEYNSSTGACTATATIALGTWKDSWQTD